MKKKCAIYNFSQSFGDVICCTPTIRKIRSFLPKDALEVYTFVPEVFKNSPYIDTVIKMNKDEKYDTKKYDVSFLPFHLGIIGQRRIDTSLVSLVDLQSLIGLGRVLEDKEKTLDLWWTKEDVIWVTKFIEENKINKEKMILLHANKTWPTRTFPDHVFYAVLGGLLDLGYDVVLIGRDYIGLEEKLSPKVFGLNKLKRPRLFNLVNKLTLHQTVALCAETKAVLTTDSGIVHVAGCTNTNIIGIFTCVAPEMRRPYRNNSYSHKWYPMRCSQCTCYDTWRIAIDIYECPKENFRCFPSANEILAHTKKVMEDSYVKGDLSFFQYEMGAQNE